MATIQGIYVALFGRPADPAGLAYFNGVTNNGADLTAIGDLASTAEYQSRFTGMSSEEIINSIYQSLFGRDGEPAGIDFFVAALENGTYNINNIAIAILDGAQGDDLATVNAKIAAANIFTANLDLDIEVDAYQGAFAASVGRDFINTVNKDDVGTEDEADAAILRLFDQGQNPDNGGGTGGGGGGGGGATGPTFFVNENGPVDVVFSGTATGDITYSTVGNTTTFMREGVIAATTVDDVKTKDLILSNTQTLVIDGDQADGQTISGAGYVAIGDIDSDIDLSGISAFGNANVSSDMTFTGSFSTTVWVNVDGVTLTVDAARADGVYIWGSGSTEITPSDDAQTLFVVTAGPNTINAGGGDDTAYSGDGDDIINGQAGSDTLYAGFGNDTVNGGAGTDLIYGDEGDDVIDGGDTAIVTPGAVVPGTTETFKFVLGGDQNADWDSGFGYINFDFANNDYDTSVFYWNFQSRGTVASAIETALEAKGFVVSVNGATINVGYPTVGNPEPDVLVSNLLGERSITGLVTTDGTNPQNTPPTASGVTAEADVLSGGDGADRFIIKASTLNAIDHITDFVGGEDTIDFWVDATYAGEKVGIGANLTDQVNSVLGQTNTNSVALFTFESKSYVLLNGDGDTDFDAGVDQLVEVTGLTGTLTDASFI